MKKYCWNVELLSPLDLETSLWNCCEETLEKCVMKWNNEHNNDFITYHKLHNIHHNRNAKDKNIIRVDKILA